MTKDDVPIPDGADPAATAHDVPVSPDHLTEQDRRRSQIEQTATDIAAG